MTSINKTLLLLALLAVLTTALSPFTDIWVSSLFYNADNGGFYFKNLFLFKFLRKGFPEIMGGFSALIILTGFFNYIKKQKYGGISIKDSLFLTFSMALGPGLIVNSILKEFSGRARPSQITVFGGEKSFTAVLQLANQCDNNCSFASGHASFAFWLTALAMIAPPQHRKLFLLLLLTVGFLVGFTRIVQGGHFLSDVIFGGIIAIIVNLWIYRLVYKKPFSFI